MLALSILSHWKTIGAKIDGDIGYNFLKHFRVTIDYHDCEIRFDGRSGSRVSEDHPRPKSRCAWRVRPSRFCWSMCMQMARTVSIRDRYRHIDHRDCT